MLRPYCRPTFRRAILPAALLAGAVGGCGFPPPLSPEQKASLDVCKADVDRTYNAQNRYQLSEREDLDAPFSNNGLPTDTARGLADQYSRDRQIDRCLNRGATAE